LTGAKIDNKRSPLKQHPLRTPGESLSEERERLLYDELAPTLTLAVVMVAFAAVQWWAFLVKAPPQPIPATLLAAGAVGYCAYRFRKAVPRLRNLNLGLDGEKSVGQFLEAHRAADWHLFHDVRGPGFNVDHILVTPKGVFAVETKTRRKPARGQAVVKYDGDKVLVNGLEPDRDPVVQARAARNWTRDLLFETTGIQYPVRGVVVFPGWFVEPPKGGKRPDIWVLNEKAFVKFVENEAVVVKSEDVALASARLVNYMTK